MESIKLNPDKMKKEELKEIALIMYALYVRKNQAGRQSNPEPIRGILSRVMVDIAKRTNLDEHIQVCNSSNVA